MTPNCIHDKNCFRQEKSDLAQTASLENFGSDMDCPKNLSDLAETEMTLGAYESAIVLWERIVFLQPENPYPISRLSSAFFLLNYYEDSLSAAQKAIALRRDAFYFAQAGISSLRLNRLEEAEDFYVTALRINPKQPLVLPQLARIEVLRKNFARAVDYLQRELALRPNSAPNCSALGNALRLHGALSEAIPVVEQAIALAPADEAYHLQLGGVLHCLGKEKEANEEYRRGRELAPKTNEALFSMGRRLVFYGDWETGKKYILEAISKEDQRVPEWENLLSLQAWECKDYAFLNHYIQSNPEHGHVATLRANRFIRQELTQNLARAALFYGDSPSFSEGYMQEMFPPNSGFIPKNNTFSNNDISGRFFNIQDGMRVTVGNPPDFDSTVHMLGSSWVQGIGCEDKGTISSQLQKLYNQTSQRVRVLNYGVVGNRTELSFMQFEALALKPNDIVLFFGPYFAPAETTVEATLPYIINMHKKCLERGALFIALEFPRLAGLSHLSAYEKSLLEFDCENMFNIAYIKEGKVFANRNRMDSNVNTPLLRANGVLAYDLLPAVQRPHDKGEIFFDFRHTTHRGNQLISSYLFNIIESIEEDSLHVKNIGKNRETSDSAAKLHVETEGLIDRAQLWHKNIYQKLYGVRPDVQNWIKKSLCPYFDLSKRIGAIIVNCNPFTNGHKFVIEYALKTVDFLYIFVVEEDSSAFTFADRLELVRQGTSHLKERVHVAPSGKFIISSMTFAEYFAKEEVVEAADSTYDVTLFGAVLAPALGITYRFVGEEPTCVVTNSYNERMKYLLPRLGVSLCVVPRKKYSGKHISASTVRKSMTTNNARLIKAIVPETTYKYLVQTGRVAEAQKRSTYTIMKSVLACLLGSHKN